MQCGRRRNAHVIVADVIFYAIGETGSALVVHDNFYEYNRFGPTGGPAMDNSVANRTRRIVKEYDTIDASDLFMVRQNLVPGGLYWYSVAAVNAAGPGPRSDRISLIAVGFVGSPLWYAGDDSIVSQSPTKLKIRWQAPLDASRTGVSNFHVDQVARTGALVDRTLVGWTRSIITGLQTPKPHAEPPDPNCSLP